MEWFLRQMCACLYSSVPGKLKQVYHDFWASLGYMQDSVSKKKKSPKQLQQAEVGDWGSVGWGLRVEWVREVGLWSCCKVGVGECEPQELTALATASGAPLHCYSVLPDLNRPERIVDFSQAKQAKSATQEEKPCKGSKRTVQRGLLRCSGFIQNKPCHGYASEEMYIFATDHLWVLSLFE